MYATLANIPFKYRTHCAQMELVLMGRRDDFKDNQYELFQDLRQELLYLMQHGVQVSLEGTIHTIPVTLCTLCGDNLGIYSLLGFKTCFRTNAFICRFCAAKGFAKTDQDIDIQDLSVIQPLFNEDQLSNSNTNDQFGTLNRSVFEGLPNITRWGLASGILFLK